MRGSWESPKDCTQLTRAEMGVSIGAEADPRYTGEQPRIERPHSDFVTLDIVVLGDNIALLICVFLAAILAFGIVIVCKGASNIRAEFNNNGWPQFAQQLSMAAGKAGLTVPKGLDAHSDKMIAPFEKLKGPAFDRRFVQETVTGHTKAIPEYQKEANNGQNADIKAYANQALPTLQKHLEQARDLQKSKGGAQSSKM